MAATQKTDLAAAIARAKRSYEYLIAIPGISPNAQLVADRWLVALPTYHKFADTTVQVKKVMGRFNPDLIDRVVRAIGSAVHRNLYNSEDGDFDAIVKLVRKDDEIAELCTRFLTASVAIDMWLDAARDSGPRDRNTRADELYRLRANIADGDPTDPDGDLAKLKDALIRASRKHESTKRASRRVAASARTGHDLREP